MKILKHILIVIFTASIFLPLQAQVESGFADNFSDGDFDNNPAWTGNAEKFRISEGMLQLYEPEAAGNSTAYLSTASQAIDEASWEFSVKYEGFSPTTSNYADVYLVANNSEITSSTAAYFVRICGNTEKNVVFYKRQGSTNTKLIEGRSLTSLLNGTSDLINIKATRSQSGTWSIFTKVNSETSFVDEGNVINTDITTSDYFGVYCKYSKTRATNFYFDDFAVSGTYFVDTEAPSLISASVLQNNQVVLTFNEEIDETSIQPENFSINNGIGTASSANLYNSEARKILLEFTNPLLSGTTYTLNYSGLSDMSGNTIQPSEVEISYIAQGEGSVVINEIMADPTPVVGLPDSEFIELLNNSQESIDLAGWTIKINNTAKTLDSYILQPSEYVVLCRAGNEELFADISNILPVTSLAATALTNSGATVILYDNYQNEIDRISYSSTWYKDASKKDGGWTLERIDPNNKCNQTMNWAASNNENGGTPGRQNSIFADNTDQMPPAVLDLSIASSNELHIVFSETLDSTAVQDFTNFSLDNDYGNPIYTAIDSENPTIVILMFAMSIEEGRVYNLTISNISDLCGNIMNQQTVQFSTMPTEFNALIVSEIMSKPTPAVALPEAKYIEIYNRSENAISLSEWTITIGSTSKTLPAAIIEPASYAILVNADLTHLFEPNINIIGVTGLPSFAQDGSTISLYDKRNFLVHTVTYSSSWHTNNAKAQGGYSLEIVDVNNPCEGASNWKSTTNILGGTPGLQNSVAESNTDATSPFPTAAEIVNDTLIVYFSEILQPELVTNDKFSIQELENHNPIFVKLLEPELRVVKMKFADSDSIIAGKIYHLNISTSIKDCSGNSIEEQQQIRFGIGVEAERNDLVINEILFNPYSGGSDFVELYNRSDKVIDLKDLWVNNAEDGAIKDSYQISSISRLLLPGEYCALSIDTEGLYNFYTIEDEKALFQVSKMPGYGDDFGTVILTKSPTRTDTIDYMNYDKYMHYQLLSSKDGVSLERVNFENSSQEASNWHSAAQDAGFATPGYQNSQYAETTDSEAQISLSSEVFSPDNDGYDDQLVINYNLDVAGYSGTITVYSANGKFVKNLIDNQSLSAAGTIAWNGFDANNKLCTPGIYIIYVELFNLEGKKIVEKHVVSINVKLD